MHENIASNNQFNHNSTMESYKSNHSSFQNNSTGTNFNSSRNVTSENGRNTRMNNENNGSMERTVLEDLEERLKVDNNESSGESSILTREQKNKQKMFTAPATVINTGGQFCFYPKKKTFKNQTPKESGNYIISPEFFRKFF